MGPHPDFEKAIKLMSEQIGSLQREFGHVLTGKNLIVDKVSYPRFPDETVNVKKGIHSLIEGSLLVYLFAMWESHVPDDINKWLTSEETKKLNSFKHVRDSVAHGYKGERANFPTRRTAFEENMPFSGIKWDQVLDTIDISNSSVALNCHQLMEQLTKKLVVRLHTSQKPVNA